MRINKFVALATGMSRRAADAAIKAGEISVQGHPAEAGEQVSETSTVTYHSKPLVLPKNFTTILLYKPVQYVCSRDGQGGRTIYELLPDTLHDLKPIGRLDKDSSGLLLLTNDGELAQQLTHPRYHKIKKYEVSLDKPLTPLHQQMISDIGIHLEDGLSKLELTKLHEGNNQAWQVTMHEGRNRQIRRTFAALGYTIIKLNRTQFGNYSLQNLRPGEYRKV